MGRLMILLITAICLTNVAVSQQRGDFADIERRTYDFYIDSAWHKLIKAGEEAIDQGVDYFYLRMRLGIASYELEKYSEAIDHFQKALEFNSADDVAKEYLYFAYRFYGREMDAHLLAQESFSRASRREFSYAMRGAVRSFSLSSTAGFIHDSEITDRYSTENIPETSGSQSVTSSYVHFGAGLEHEAGNRLRITHAAGYYSKDYLFFSREADEDRIIRDAKVNQFQYYISGRVLLFNGTYLVPAVHYLNVQIPSEAVLAGRGRTSSIQQQIINNHDVATSLGLERFAGKIRSGFSAGYSNINAQQQLRGTLSFTWLPLGNLNLYSASDISYYMVVPGDGYDGKYVYTHNVGFRTFPGLWLELWGRFGEMENFAGPGAYLVYNDIGPVKGQYGISLIAPFVSERIEMALHYNYTIMESRFIPDDSGVVNNIYFDRTNYNNITAGIKWKF